MATAIKITGVDEALRKIDAAHARLDDMTPILRVVAEDLKTLIDDSFDQSRSPSGVGFAPLKSATVKRRRGGSSKPLVDTGTLRNSVSVRTTPKSVMFGTNTPYAGFHQMGTARVVARPFLPVEGGSGGFVFMMTGPSADFVARAKESIVHYVKTGEVV
jgi:phage virion morphogenesis protein